MFAWITPTNGERLYRDKEFLNRGEYNSQHERLKEDVKELQKYMATQQGMATQSSVNKATIIAVSGVIIAIMGLVIHIMTT